MLEKMNVDFRHSDERGTLCQIFHNDNIQINSLITKKNVTRGNHYHKKATEYFYVVSGKVKVVCKDAAGEQFSMFETNDFFVIRPNTVHQMLFLEDTVMIAFYDRPIEDCRGGKDIFKG